MEESKVIHETINGKYRVVFEKAASANKIDGFKVESCGNDLIPTFEDAEKLYHSALMTVEANKPAVTLGKVI